MIRVRLIATLAALATISPPFASAIAQQAQDRSDFEARVAALDTIDLSEEPEKKLAELKALEAEARKIKGVTPRTISRIRAEIGGALFYLRRYDEAVATVDEAYEILRKAGLGDGDEAAQLLSNSATILSDRAMYDQALERHRKALAIRTRLHGKRSLEAGSTSFGIGYILFRQGKIEEALEWLGRGAELQLELGREGDPLAVVRLTSYASALGTAGRIEDSIAAARKAAGYAETYLPKTHPMTGVALNNLGKALNVSGHYGEAVAVFRRALDVRVAAHGEKHPNTAIALTNLAMPLFTIGGTEEAEALLTQAAQIYTASAETADPAALGGIHAQLATIAGARGDRLLQEQRLRTAIATLEKNAGMDHVALVEPLVELAELLHRTGRTGEALPFAERAVTSARKAYAVDHHLRSGAEIVQAQLLVASGVHSAFSQAANAAAAIERRMLDVTGTRADAITLGPINALSLKRFAELALETGHEAAAFRALQLVNLTETAATTSAVAARAAARDAQVAEMVRALQDQARRAHQLRSQHSKALAAKDDAEVQRLSQAIASADAALAAGASALEARFPDYKAISRPTPVALEAYRAGMAPGSALLAPFAVDGRLISVAVTREGLAWARSQAKDADFKAAAVAVRTSVESGEGSFDRGAAYRLYGYLFPNVVRDHVASARTLLLYGGGGEMAKLPLGLLVTKAPQGRDDDQRALRKTAWLIRDKAVAVEVALAGHATRTARPVTRFAGFGAPQVDGKPLKLTQVSRSGTGALDTIRDLPPLPGAAQELLRLRRSFGGDSGSIVLTGADASEARVRGMDLSPFSVLAFATHGLAANEVDGLDEPALVLTPPATPSGSDDGLLTASEIASLRLDADWVILSACNTAAGSTQAAPSYTGLAHAFLYAGARSLLLSHWQVRDDAASRLSVATVRGTESGLARAEALRRAMLALIADRDVPGGAHPAVWAPFVLIRE